MRWSGRKWALARNARLRRGDGRASFVKDAVESLREFDEGVNALGWHLQSLSDGLQKPLLLGMGLVISCRHARELKQERIRLLAANTTDVVEQLVEWAGMRGIRVEANLPEDRGLDLLLTGMKVLIGLNHEQDGPTERVLLLVGEKVEEHEIGR